MICNNTGEYLAFHAAVESEGSIVRRDTTDPLLRPGRIKDFWWIKQALKYAQRRGYWMNVARATKCQFTVEQAIKHARSSNRDMLWAIRGAPEILMKAHTFLWILGGVTALITIVCALFAGDPDYDVRDDDWRDK